MSVAGWRGRLGTGAFGALLVVLQAAPAAAQTTLLDESGTGSRSTRRFTVPTDWDLRWRFNCPTEDNFFVDVRRSSDGQLSGDLSVSQHGRGRNGIQHYHSGGDRYLDVVTGSNCNWRVEVIDPVGTTTTSSSTSTTRSTTTTRPTTTSSSSTSTTRPGGATGTTSTTRPPGGTTTTTRPGGSGTTTTTVTTGTASPATANPSSVSPGGSTTVAGEGFAPNSQLSITFAGAAATPPSVTSDASGKFSVAVTVPNSASAGTKTITVTGRNAQGGTHVASATVTVNATLARTGSGPLLGRMVLTAALIILGGWWIFERASWTAPVSSPDWVPFRRRRIRR